MRACGLQLTGKGALLLQGGLPGAPTLGCLICAVDSSLLSSSTMCCLCSILPPICPLLVAVDPIRQEPPPIFYKVRIELSFLFVRHQRNYPVHTLSPHHTLLPWLSPHPSPQGSKYADRLPIGTEAVIRRGPAATVRAFYERWYRPENMTLVAVGDFAEPGERLEGASRAPGGLAHWPAP